MVAIYRGTSTSETFTPTYQPASNPFGESSALVYGNGGDDRFIVRPLGDEINRSDIVAGSGDDLADVAEGRGYFLAGAGDDTLYLRSGQYQYDADAGNDTLRLDGPISAFSIFSAGAGSTILGADTANASLYAQSAMVETYQFSDVVVRQDDGNQLVDDLHYLSRNPDVAAAGVDPEIHYANFGWREGRDPNLFFDTRAYLDTYADVRAAGVNPLEHYRTFGWREGRDPSGSFDTTAYLEANPDVAAAGVNPLEHYLNFGVNEGRTFVADGILDV